MSYILEALKKADQERTIGDVPDLESTHWGERSEPRSYRWVFIVAALLLVNVVLLTVLFGEREPAGNKAVDVVASRAEPEQQAPALAAATEDSVIAPRQKVAPGVRPYVPTPPVRVRQSPATAAVQAQHAPIARAAPPVASPASASGVPDWNELSLEFRSGFNPPHIDVHVYSEQPSRRFILVELKKYREGDSLPSGAQLEKILPGSIQLYYQGTRFLLDKQ